VWPTNTLYGVTDSGLDPLPGVVPGNVLKLNQNLSTSPPAFRGSRIVYTAALHLAGDNSGWNAMATWNVP
jgi:hypothetical protein